MIINVDAGSGGARRKFQAVWRIDRRGANRSPLLQAGFLYKRYQAHEGQIRTLAQLLDQACALRPGAIELNAADVAQGESTK